MAEEKTIILARYFEKKDVYDVIGAGEKELSEVAEKIKSQYTVETLQKKLNLSTEEILKATQHLSMGYLSMGDVALLIWISDKLRKQITLFELVGTIMLIRSMMGTLEKLSRDKGEPIEFVEFTPIDEKKQGMAG